MKGLLRVLRVALVVFIGLICVAWIIWHGHVLPRSNENKDEFFSAVESGNVVQVTRMLESGENPNKRSIYGTPLTRAASAGQTAIVELLIERGADVDLTIFGTSYTPLSCAIQGKHVETAKALLERGADLSKATEYGGTPLLRASASGPPELVTLLLNHGADVRQRDDRGWQPLHVALRASQLSDDERRSIVESLLAHGADPNGLNAGGWQEDSKHDSHIGRRTKTLPNKGNTPLAIALSNGFSGIVESLKAHGATRLDE